MIKLCIASLLFLAPAAAAENCDVYCDKRDPVFARADRTLATSVWSRDIVLHISDIDDMAWASVEDGKEGDEVWLDRSWNAGRDWDKLNATSIPEGKRGWRTMMFTINDPSQKLLGAVRACGKAGDRSEVACTPWAAAKLEGDSPGAAAALALMQLYDWRRGNWTDSWWVAANALTAMVDYFEKTGQTRFRSVIARTFDANKSKQGGNFTNEFIDDTGWWGLAWIRAYDYTHEARYLDMARRDADYMFEHWDNTCTGGAWWTTERKYKNAIANELLLKLAAALHNRIPDDVHYLGLAKLEWEWFKASGMINPLGLVNDGLNACKNNSGTTWTYNQGVILGGLAELYKATGDKDLLATGNRIAKAAVARLSVGGVLTEPCGLKCKGDALAFKGIFVRNLAEFARTARTSAYDAFLRKQAAALHSRACDPDGRCGWDWSRAFNGVDLGSQQSALDAFNAAR